MYQWSFESDQSILKSRSNYKEHKSNIIELKITSEECEESINQNNWRQACLSTYTTVHIRKTKDVPPLFFYFSSFSLTHYDEREVLWSWYIHFLTAYQIDSHGQCKEWKVKKDKIPTKKNYLQNVHVTTMWLFLFD